MSFFYKSSLDYLVVSVYRKLKTIMKLKMAPTNILKVEESILFSRKFIVFNLAYNEKEGSKDAGDTSTEN